MMELTHVQKWLWIRLGDVDCIKMNRDLGGSDIDTQIRAKPTRTNSTPHLLLEQQKWGLSPDNLGSLANIGGETWNAEPYDNAYIHARIYQTAAIYRLKNCRESFNKVFRMFQVEACCCTVAFSQIKESGVLSSLDSTPSARSWWMPIASSNGTGTKL